jgi:5-methyltetrahydropteroyltriglutamate--homocysteine methyltransferase
MTKEVAMAATAPHNPPFRADHVGSLLRPTQLKEARQDHAAAKISAADLRKVQDAAIRRVVVQQEEAGLQSITDGEFRRDIFYGDFFCKGLGGATIYQEIEKFFFIDDAGRKLPVPIAKVTGRMQWRAPVHVDDFKFLRSLTKRTPKITMPSPALIYFPSGRDGVSREAYADLDPLWDDLAFAYQNEFKALHDAGCRYIQIDEVPVVMLGDPNFRDGVKSRGDDPDYLLNDLFPKVMNRCLGNRPASLHLSMHICRGNNQSAWVSTGSYDSVADVVFNQVDVDSYFLEYDTARAGTFEPLRFVPKNKTVVLGLVSSKLPQLESKDSLKRRIDEAAKYIDLGQLALSPQCGFASTAPGNRLSELEQFAKLRLIVEVAREVWGEKELARSSGN